MGGAAGRQVAPAAPTVNNFAAEPVTDWISPGMAAIRFPFSRPGGSGLLTYSRLNDCLSRHSCEATADDLIDRPAGRGLTL
jgi:hypothetical protein